MEWLDHDGLAVGALRFGYNPDEFTPTLENRKAPLARRAFAIGSVLRKL